MILFQNFHRHSSDSNIFTADSAMVVEDYAKRAIELGHTILSSCEHGFQGRYYEVYEMAKKYNLKFIFGTEAYWVKDRFEKDRTNGHICIFAKSEIGRKSINRILSEANIDGYYYKPRVDIELLLSLPPSEVFISTACIAFWKYDDIEDIIWKLHNHFGNNFFLEVQYHHTDIQREVNKRILDLGLNIVMGCDSHYIYPEQAQGRDDVLEARGIRYEGEEGWFLDYPDGDTAYQRFVDQGVLSHGQIMEAINNTNIFLEFDDIEFDKNIKLPSLYPNLSLEEKNKIYTSLLTEKWKEFSKDIDPSKHELYLQEIQKEVNIVRNTGMVDYFLMDYEIVKQAIADGGIITNSGRGSGVSFITNTLLGFSKVDRISSPVKLYPERFMSETRILQTKSLPDLDLNCGTPEIFVQAQDKILGEGHAYPMIAYGKFKIKSAFKLYAKSQSMPFEIANEITNQIEKYERDLKYADEDDKDLINVYDYVEEKHHEILKGSEKYMGIIASKSAHPCGYLLYQGNIKEDIGLIKCKSESTKKEVVTTVIDGTVAEKYKFLKNDLLKVDVVLLIDKVYKRIGIKPHTVNELLTIIKDDPKTWGIYAKGLTIGVNQVEKPSTTQKAMKYKASNISELTALIAAIRPGFKSMYHTFETRKPFNYNTPSFDKLIQTEEMPFSFVLYQEQTMATLQYAGFPMDESYGILKAISKKKAEIIIPLKERFLDGFSKKLILDENITLELALEKSEDIWKIIADSVNYSFNASHALSYAIDSAYCAYLKAHYPYEFYEVMLQSYSDKGNKDKVALFKKEMIEGFGISEGEYKFGLDNTKFLADKENKTIYPEMLSIKFLNKEMAHILLKLSKKKYESFYELLRIIKGTKVNSRQLDILIKLGYFRDYAEIKKIQLFNEYYDLLGESKQISKEKAILSELPIELIEKYSRSTDKTYVELDVDNILLELWDGIPNESLNIRDQIQNEIELLGYAKSINTNISPDYGIVIELNTKYSPIPTIYRINDGSIETIKTDTRKYKANPFQQFDMIKTITKEPRNKKKYMGKNEKGKGIYETLEEKEDILTQWTIVTFD